MIELPKIEFKSAQEIEDFQFMNLKNTLQYAAKHSTFYKQHWGENNIDIAKINSLEDFQKLPFTTKNHIQTYNNQMLAVPEEKIIDWATTSGTMGNPVSFGLTHKDIDRLGYNEALTFVRCGISNLDVIQITTTIDKRFMAGLAYYEGAKKIGAGIVRMGPGAIGLQWDSIKRFKTTVLIGVPSFILKLKEYALGNNININTSTIKKIICIGEPIRTPSLSLNYLARQITNSWNVQLYSTYASTEMSTAFTECEFGVGGHLNPELAFIEVLDVDNNPVNDGGKGEIVFTSLLTEAMPLIRFRTGDIATLYDKNCSCGSNTKRIGPILGRKEHLLKFKGTSIYPIEIFQLLQQYVNGSNYILEISNNEFGNDEIKIRIDISEELKDSLIKHFKTHLRVTPEIIIDSTASILNKKNPKGSRKPKHIFDYREKNYL